MTHWMLEAIECTAIFGLFVLLLRERAARRREREDAVPDAFAREDLSEVEERLAGLLAETRRTLAEDLAALHAVRAEPAPPPAAPSQPPPPPRATERPRSVDHEAILRLLAEGVAPADVARRLGKSPHEVRLIERLGRKA